jgi:MFS family permease
MFPQLGAPIGFFFATGVFLLLSRTLTEQQFLAWGWRLPFAGSAALVLVGLYVRLTIEETPVFRAALQRHEHVRLPAMTVFREHVRQLWPACSHR